MSVLWLQAAVPGLPAGNLGGGGGASMVRSAKNPVIGALGSKGPSKEPPSCRGPSPSQERRGPVALRSPSPDALRPDHNVQRQEEPRSVLSSRAPNPNTWSLLLFPSSPHPATRSHRLL